MLSAATSSRQTTGSVAAATGRSGRAVQISAQIARAGRWRIYEVGISYFGRTYEEGKKVTWRDGVKALWYLVRFRLAR